MNISDRIGSYELISDDGTPNGARRVILDTNVAIDIERFFFKDNSLRNEGLDELLKRFPPHSYVDINFGAAVAESCAPRTGGFDRERAEKMVYALDKVISWKPSAVERNFKNRHAPCKRDKALKKSSPRAKDVPTLDFRWLMSPTYAYMLYLQKLISSKSKWKGEPIKAAEAFLSWATDNVKNVPTYELALVAGYIGGNSNHLDSVHKLLKTSDKDTADQRAHKAWNAAWDIFMVRQTDGFSRGLFGPEISAKKTVLVSRNIDPVMIRSLTHVEEVIGDYPLMHIELAQDKRGVGERINAMMQEIPVSSWKRINRTDEDIQSSLVKSIEELEYELGVSNIFNIGN